MSNCITNAVSVNSDPFVPQIRQFKLPDFPIVAFLSIGFTHHIRILESAKTLEERLFGQMLFGIQAARDTLVSEIARSLQEDIRPRARTVV